MTARVRQVCVPDTAEPVWEEVPAGTRLLDTIPKVDGPIVLRLNGEYGTRDAWPESIEAGETVEWIVQHPQDREDFRTVLAVAAIVVSFAAGGAGAGPALKFAAAALTVANLAYNLLVPPKGLPEQEKGDQKYTGALTGNVARIDDPIPRGCGIERSNPPFACIPYYEYNEKSDQFIYAIFSLGYGPSEILADFIGKTPVNSFADVLAHRYLKPGEQPSSVKANVVTTTEVGGQDLVPGRYVPGGGGYPATKPGQLAEAIGYDIVGPQGIGKIEADGGSGVVTVSWQVDYQQIDDGGAPLGNWELLDAGSWTMDTNTPVRRSYKKTLPSPMRVQIRFGRTNLSEDKASVRDQIQLGGMRAYLSEPAPLNPHCAHYEIVLRASEQLTSAAQTDFNLIQQFKCRTWSPSEGWNCEIGDFDNYVATRNPAWWLADLWSDPVWGEGLDDSRIDLETLYELAGVWDARQDRFDFIFKDATDAWTAGQSIASVGRARMFRRAGSVRSLARDELVDTAEDVITARMTVDGSEITIDEKPVRGSDPDGIIVTYLSNRTWDIEQIECPCPGVVEMTQPVYQSLDGIRGFNHAKREGLYQAANMLLRRRTMTAKLEMQAIRATVLQPYMVLPQIPGYGSVTGDVVDFDAETLVMSLTEPVYFDVGPLYIRLRRDDGSFTAPQQCFPGPTEHDVVLSEEPDFAVIADDGTRERPVFLIGPTTGAELAKVSSIRPADGSPRGSPYYDLEFLVDDTRVHTADEAYLPGPGDDQDPILLPGDPGSSNVLVPNLVPAPGYVYSVGGGTALVDVAYGQPTQTSRLTFKNNGLATDHEGNVIERVWMLFGEVELSDASQFEIRFTFRTDVSYFLVTTAYGFAMTTDAASVIAPNGGSPLNTWLPLSADQEISLTLDGGSIPYAEAVSTVQVEIRRVGALANSVSGIAYLWARLE